MVIAEELLLLTFPWLCFCKSKTVICIQILPQSCSRAAIEKFSSTKEQIELKLGNGLFKRQLFFSVPNVPDFQKLCFSNWMKSAAPRQKNYCLPRYWVALHTKVPNYGYFANFSIDFTCKQQNNPVIICCQTQQKLLKLKSSLSKTGSFCLLKFTISAAFWLLPRTWKADLNRPQSEFFRELHLAP